MFAATGTLLKTVKEFENDWKVRCGTEGARLLLCDRGGMWELGPGIDSRSNSPAERRA